jgi:hypothetical protein
MKRWRLKTAHGEVELDLTNELGELEFTGAPAAIELVRRELALITGAGGSSLAVFASEADLERAFRQPRLACYLPARVEVLDERV